jgi:2-C-methyl-D-erythritol 4-phosphate cytidylyltransferase
VETLPRATLRAVQTPQGFRRDVLERAHAARLPGSVTDDAALVEALGLPVLVIPGDPLAHKITTPADLDRVVGLVDSGGADAD